MYKLTFLGPSREMNAGGFDWVQGKSRELEGGVARELMRRYRYAQWELEEIAPVPAPEPKSKPKSKRRSQSKPDPEPVVEEEDKSPWMATEEVPEEEDSEE